MDHWQWICQVGILYWWWFWCIAWWDERSMHWAPCLVPPAILWLTHIALLGRRVYILFLQLQIFQIKLNFDLLPCKDLLLCWVLEWKTQVLYDGVSVRLYARFTSGSGKRTLRHFRSGGTRWRAAAEFGSIANVCLSCQRLPSIKVKKV